jgi:formylglycine-generating enzyme required for sulfatase activity
VGFAAKESTNRISAGASYYGVLDMTGNASEWCIQLYFSNYANLSYSNVGDGSLPVSGYNDTPNWTNSAVNLQRSIIPRGGSWSTSWGPTYDGYITVSGINNTSDNGDLVRSHGLHMRGVR